MIQNIKIRNIGNQYQKKEMNQIIIPMIFVV